MLGQPDQVILISAASMQQNHHGRVFSGRSGTDDHRCSVITHAATLIVACDLYPVRVAKKKVSGGTPATVALDQAKIAYELRAYAHDPAAESYGLEAAETLGVPPARVFKTLVVSTDPGLAVGIVPVDRKLDLKALAAALGLKKVTMADPAAAQRATGYVVGGISPIGQKTALPSVLDASASNHPTILVSGGKRGLDIELSPADLIAVAGATTAPIATS